MCKIEGVTLEDAFLYKGLKIKIKTQYQFACVYKNFTF